MNVREEPVVFDCEGDELIGMLHIPEKIRTRGLIAIVAGGPQYRGGVGRLQVQLARELAVHGIPMLRYDYRGLGDSEGRFRGFQDVEADFRAAIRCFREQVPSVNEFVLWGGCDAAAAILINAWKYPEVTGIIVGNPWVHTEETGDAVTVKHHYAKRIRDKDFWLKVVRLQYNPLPAAATVFRTLLKRIDARRGGTPKVAASDFQDNPTQPFVLRMRNGLTRFKGDLLLLMSGRSLVSKEFDELITRDKPWQIATQSPRTFTRHDMPEADQTYSSIASRRDVIEIARRWMSEGHATK